MQKSVLDQIHSYSVEEKEKILNENHITYETYSTVGGKIDNSRTHLNYRFIEREETWSDERLKELGFSEKDECIGSSVFRLPVDYVGNEREFFEFVFIEIQNDIGKDNMIQAIVHKDQKIPHIHLMYILVKEKEKGENET